MPTFSSLSRMLKLSWSAGHPHHGAQEDGGHECSLSLKALLRCCFCFCSSLVGMLLGSASSERVIQCTAEAASHGCRLCCSAGRGQEHPLRGFVHSPFFWGWENGEGGVTLRSSPASHVPGVTPPTFISRRQEMRELSLVREELFRDNISPFPSLVAQPALVAIPSAGSSGMCYKPVVQYRQGNESTTPCLSPCQ